MTDERRWTIRVCWDGEICDDPDCRVAPCDLSSLVDVVPASSVVPIARLREWVATARLERLLDDVECASNPNNERTTSDAE